MRSRSIAINAVVSNPPLNRSALFLTVGFIAFILVSASAQSQSMSRLQTAEWMKTNFDIMSIDPSEIMSGGPPKDGIPAIDRPKFVSQTDAFEWLEDNEPVIAFEHAGVARAYPLQILMFHEIVNDVVGGKAFAVTFCPLCNASIVFVREVDGEILDFGTTGRLRKSDLVMYDRQTESWWQQFNGTGIVGDYTGTRLNRVASQIVSFKTFRHAFPKGEILSRETGFYRQYGRNPYQGYDSMDNTPFLYRDELDPRLSPMERVLSVPASDGYHLVPLSILENETLLHMELGDESVVIFATETAASALDKSVIAESKEVPAAAAFNAKHNGETLEFEIRGGKIMDLATGSVWNALGHATDGELAGERLQQLDSGVHFAFAWLAFDPEASIFEK